MNKLKLIALFSFFSIGLFAQAPVKTIVIDGAVLDSATIKPLSFVTISLADAITKQAVKSTLTKDDGTFKLSGLAPKAYLLSFVYVGYKTKTIQVNGVDDFHSGSVALSTSSSKLKEVSVSALKPLTRQEVDRISYDVQADPESKSITALDMMNKVPLVSVDASDNIKLRGSGNYKILLNGKESALMAKNPSDILKSMPASNIVKIEVITTPPAKYDAEGLAGIINIITKKNAAQGYSGSVNSNYNTVNGSRLNLNTTVKQGKFGISGFAGTADRPLRVSEFDNQTTFITVPSRTLQNGMRGSGNTNTFANAELSFELDTLNLLTGTFNISKNDNKQATDQFISLYNAADALTQAYHVTNNATGTGHGSDVAINYQLGFKRNKDRLLTASYKYSTFDNNQFNDVTTTQASAQNYRQYNNSYSKEHTTQLDYIQPMKLLTLEAGGKMILRNSFSGFNNDVLNGLTYQTDPAQTNNFTYHQDVYSVYNSYTVKFTKWTFKGGARFESTKIKADFTSTSTTVDQRFNNLVPSLSVQRALKSNETLTFGFTERIQRPGIFQLNPFADSSNPLYITMGNPQLKPAVNNNFELSYGNYNKGSFTFSTSYQFANNTIQNIASVNGNVTTTTFANIGKTRQLGFDLNTNYPITKQFNINVNAELLQIWLQGTYNGQLFENSGQQGHIFTNYTYKFIDGYRLAANIGFDSRYVLIQGRDNWFFGSGIAAGKDFFKGKVSASVQVNNPFSKFNKLDFFTKTPDFATVSSNLNYYRFGNLSLNYKFGKLNSDIKKNKRGINNDDAASGR